MKRIQQPALALAFVLLLEPGAALAQVAVDGTLNVSEGYGNPLATQTINTGFGDNLSSSGTSGGGSELDAAYAVVTNGYLNLFIAGNVQANGNNIDVFIASGQSAGQQILQIGGSPSEAAMNGSVFSPGFTPDFLFTFTNSATTLAVHRVDLSVSPGVLTVLGNITLSGGNGSGPNIGGSGIAVGFNNTNTAGVNGSGGTAANLAAANAVKTGLEISIPLSVLGNPNGSVQILIAINGNHFAYLSNQFLPGLPVGTGNVGGGGTGFGSGGGVFDFGSTAGEYLTITLPVSGTNNPVPVASNVGATLPYLEYEAENAVVTGTIIGPSRTFLDQASEASGRRAVSLNGTGQYVEFTLEQPANSIVVRYCIPDSANGDGLTNTLSLYVDGAYRTNLTLSSTYSWVYGAYPYSNTPGAGSAHHFYDEVSALIGELPAGTKVRLQRDSINTASYYLIDLVDFEEASAAASPPAGFLSITSYGATPNDGVNDTAAFQSAVTAAQNQGKGLWIPPGVFLVTGTINLSGTTIRGAGPWYSVLRGLNCNLYGNGGIIKLSGFKLDGLTTTRTTGVSGSGSTGIEGVYGAGSVISNLWIEHTSPGIWIDGPTSGLLIYGCRIRNTFSDGINLAYGTSATTVQQCDIRNTGDDCLAMWSYTLYGTGQDANNVFQNNTLQLPLLANGIGIYGGTNHAALNNWIRDTVVNGAGIQIANRFTSYSLSGTTLIGGNYLERAGSYSSDFGYGVGAIWLFAYDSDITGQIVVTNNFVNDSTYQGVLLSGLSSSRTISRTAFTALDVDVAGTCGIQINTKGAGYFQSATFSNAPSGAMQLNNANYQVTYGLSAPPAATNPYPYAIGNTATFTWPGVTDLDGGSLAYRVCVGTTPGGANVLNSIITGNFVTVTNVIGNMLYALVSVINNGSLEGPGFASSGTLLLAAAGDQDNDGMSNQAENIAGTNPLDANSLLQITGWLAGSLTWSSVSNKTYQVLSTTNLAAGFTPISGVLTGAGPVMVYLDSGATNASKFYKVQVSP